MELNIAKPGNGAAAGTSGSDVTFTREFNEDLVHQVVIPFWLVLVRVLVPKTRSEVVVAASHGVKGTGRARAGTIRSPIWTGGGVTLRRSLRSQSKVNRKMYRAALRSILSGWLVRSVWLSLKKWHLKHLRPSCLLSHG